METKRDNTYLRSTYFIEQHEYDRLNKPRKDEILFPSSEQQPRAEGECHLRHEAHKGGLHDSTP